MSGRRFDVGALFVHLAIVAGVVGGALLLLRQMPAALTLLAIATGLAVLGHRTPPPLPQRGDSPAPGPAQSASPHDGLRPIPTRPVGDDESEPRDVIHPHPAPPGEDHRDLVVPRLPPPPAGRPVDVWAPADRRVRVHSGAMHTHAVDRARRHGPLLRAVLVSDVLSPHHPYAVAVFVEGEHIGDLSDDALLDYGPRCAALAAQGLDLRTQAFLMPGGVDIALPDPAGLVPANDVPAGVVLPHGMPLTVETAPPIREAPADADPMTTTPDRLLRRYARPGEDVWLAVTLAADRPPHRRDGVRAVAVLLDGVVVGHLAPADVDDIAPLLAHLGDHHEATVAAAVLRGSSLHRRLTVSCIRAQDADEAWLRRLGT